MKFASYSLAELRARKGDQDLLSDSVDTGSVHTNISLQVPVFEERLNGTYVLQRIRREREKKSMSGRERESVCE
jgi:hypothetical protein